MPLLDDMIKHLKTRIANASKPYSQYVYFADVHYKAKSKNTGFKKILAKIKKEKNDTLLILIGGDLVDGGTDANYKAFVKECKTFYGQTKIPIIPTMGNHEFYSVKSGTTALKQYEKYIGKQNFRIEISKKGLLDSLSIIAFNDAKPNKLESIKVPTKSCTWKNKDKHLFYFPYNYIKYSSQAPEKYSHFPDYLKAAKGKHIAIVSHVPLRKKPLVDMLDNYIKKTFSKCTNVPNPPTTLADLITYYRNLWMLVHGNSTIDKNDSTQWFLDAIKNRKKVQLVLMGHVHTYYPFSLNEGNHKIQFVISGGGGNSSCTTYDSNHPVDKYHYIKVKYDTTKKKFVTNKVNVSN